MKAKVYCIKHSNETKMKMYEFHHTCNEIVVL